MAKYQVTRRCGHGETVNLVGKHRDREWRLENVEQGKLCSTCYEKNLKEKIERENQAAAAATKEMELPELNGSPKQVAWANTLRIKFINDFDALLERRTEIKEEDRKKLFIVRDYILENKVRASYYIDNRDVGCQSMLMASGKEALKPEEEKVAEREEEKIHKEVKMESTVRPESPVTETIAEIRIKDKELSIIFPEYRKDFWTIVKKKLRMAWQDGAWSREVDEYAHPIEDRAAEAGHRLLAGGFPVCIYDQQTREKAINADYKREQTRWIKNIKGKFGITWRRPDDYYKVARKLPGSKWSKPYVIVPREQYEEVLGFAAQYGFSMEVRAQELAEEAREAKERALLVKPEQIDDVAYVASTKPPKLDVPEEVSIDDELKD